MSERLIGGGVFPLPTPLTRATSSTDGFLPPSAHAVLRFANARSAFYYLARALRPRRVWLPSYLCQSVVEGFRAGGALVAFFSVDEQLRVNDDGWLREVAARDLVVRTHYFGFENDDAVFLAAGRLGARLVDDAAQALLTGGLGATAEFVVFSPRKFVGVPDGGYLVQMGSGAMKEPKLTEPPAAWWRTSLAAVLRRRDFETGAADRSWHELFQAAEREAPIGPFAMSSLSRILLESGIDYSDVRGRRRANYRMLLHAFADVAVFPSLPPNVVPLGFPIRLPDRDHTRLGLFKRAIFPAVHWPVPADVPAAHAASRALAAQILTLPCDQRYDATDMTRLIDAVRDARSVG